MEEATPAEVIEFLKRTGHDRGSTTSKIVEYRRKNKGRILTRTCGTSKRRRHTNLLDTIREAKKFKAP